MSAVPVEDQALVSGVRTIHAVLDSMTPALWEAADPEVVRQLSGRLSRVISRAQAQKLHAARRLEQAQTVKTSGASSTGQLISEDFGGDRRDEDQIVTTARKIDTRSALQKALDKGDVTLKQSQVIASTFTRCLRCIVNWSSGV